MSVNHHLSDFDSVLHSMRQKSVSLGALFKIFHDNSSTLASDQLRKDKSLYGTFAKDALPWAFEAVTTELCREVHQLSQRSHGLHFNNAKATANFLEGSFMEKAAEKMRLEAPLLWKMVNNLLDASPRKRRVENKKNIEPEVTASVEDATLHRLGN
jgi:hypothetical protein